MIKLRDIAVATACCVLAPSAINAQASVDESATARKTGTFNFEYAKRGEARLLPLQVFDDGRNTYFQFRGGNQVVPAILVDNGDVQYTAAPTPHGPYVVIAGVNRRYLLGYNTLRAEVLHSSALASASGGEMRTAAETGQPRAIKVATQLTMSSPPARAIPTFGATAPVVGDGGDANLAMAPQSSNSLRVPFSVNSTALSKPAIEMIRKAMQQGEVVGASIVGRDDENFREGVAFGRAKAIADLLVRYGVPRSAIATREGFPLEGMRANRPTSDLVLRFAPRAVRASAMSDATTIASSLALIQRGLMGLARLGALSETTATGIYGWVSRSVMHTGSERPTNAPDRSLESAEEQFVMTAEDATMRQALERWARAAGYSVEWTASYDIPVNGSIQFRGPFLVAVASAVEQARKRAPGTYVQMDGKRIVIGGQG